MTDLNEYEKQLRAHDWWHMMSDDHKVWQAGEDSLRKLQVISRQSPAHRELYEKVRQEILGC